MSPTLEPGDRLLAVRAWRVRSGDLVVVHDPRLEQRLLVKRVLAVDGDRVVVRGDNFLEEASTDSRVFGPVSRRLVAGRVVRRYAPSERARIFKRGVDRADLGGRGGALPSRSDLARRGA